jgi:hypothetical protein
VQWPIGGIVIGGWADDSADKAICDPERYMAKHMRVLRKALRGAGSTYKDLKKIPTS